MVLRRSRGRHGAIEEAIRKSGYDPVHASDSDFSLGGDVVWVQGNINWFPRARRMLLTAARNRPAVMVWHSEPLPFPRHSGFPNPRLTLREIAKIALRDSRATDSYTNYYRLREMFLRGAIDLLVVSSRARQTFLADKGIPSEFVPLGFHAGMGRLLGGARDIDVLFLGSMDDSRHRSALRFLRSRGVNVEALGSWEKGPTWGEPRTQLINRAKIFLNIQRHAGQYSGLRMLLGMGNGAMVLSEPVYDPFPYEPGVHYVSTPLDEMPVTISKYLADGTARNIIAAEGHRFATQSVTLQNSIARISVLIEQMLARRSA